VKLDLRFIVPGSTPGTILLASNGVLPAVLVDGDEDEATVVAATAFLRDGWQFAAPVLETHPKGEGVPDGEPIPTLVMTEPAAADWTPSEGLAFAPIPSDAAVPLGGLPAAIRARAEELFAELHTRAEPPPLRPRWARRGWHARASTWMTEALASAGRPLLEPPRPFYLRGISALLRGRTAAGDVFLKAVFPPFHAEPALTRLLAERFPSAVPAVLAIEPDEGWQLVEDLAAPWVYDLPAPEKAAGLAAGARTLVEIQRAITADDIDALATAGSPRRPLDGIPDAFAAAAGPDAISFVEGTVELARRERAMAVTRVAVERVAGLGFPESVVHGDFHAGNAALVDDRVVIIDWSDAAIGHPAIDLVTWLSWSKDEPDDQAAAIDAWIGAWGGAVDEAAVREAVDDILIVGAAYQVVSYDGIVRALEPATRYTMAGGATHYLERLEERAARSGSPPS
jgi:aminoglycoside phosphotransferase (APT) family kinase protein